MNNMELETDIEALDMEMGDITIHYCPVIPNPEGEPTAELKTADIEGTIYEIVDEEARTELENKVDKVEGKGLSENDYTDEDKAIVDGVTTALDGKVDKDGDKVLSDNNYSDEDKAIVDGVTEALNGKADKSDTYTKLEVDSALENKVNKDGDKVLSDNNYSDTDKSIVDGVTTALLDKVDKEEGKGLSSNDYTDTEKALVGTIDNKLGKTETAVNANGLVIATPVTDTAPYIYRQTPVKESFKALMKKIVGASVVWNQLGFQTGYSATGQYSPMFRSSTESLKVDTLSGHKYLISFIQPSGCAVYRQNRTGLTVGYQGYSAPTSNTRISFLVSCTESQTQLDLAPLISKNATTEESYYLTNAIFTDLTAMFGTTIADHVYTLETSQSGSGIAWLQSYGFFTEDYYTYKQNKLESGCVSAHKTYDGETLLTNTELSPITLRGLFKLSTDKLTVDGDEYNADGSVTRNYVEYNITSNTELYGFVYSAEYGAYAFLSEADYLIKRANIPISDKIKCVDYNNRLVDTTENRLYVEPQGRLVLRSKASESITTVQLLLNEFIGASIQCKLATPTTEQTTPFTETEIVGSTEEFIDYEVAQSNRDVAIPVGTDTDYYQEMKLPSLPTTSGNHNLIYNVATGFGWS